MSDEIQQPQGGDGTQQQNSTPDLSQQLSNLASRQGGLDAAGLLLMTENREYRGRIRELENQLATAQQSAPADGAIVLTGDDAAAWNAYRELGTADELSTMRNEYATLSHNRRIANAAEPFGYKTTVLSTLLNGVDFEFKETEIDGEKREVAYVGDQRLDEYVATNHKDFIPALAPQAQSKSSGTKFLKQDAGGKPTKGGYVSRRLAQRKEAQGN